MKNLKMTAINAWQTVIVCAVMSLLFVAAVPASAQVTGGHGSLFSDRKAVVIGDLVTILLMEYSSGSNEAKTNTGFEHLLESSSGATGAASVLPTFGLKTGITSDQKSNGNTSRQGSLKGKLSARVVEILPNNHLRLEGQRKVIINGEEQLTILSGIVRRSDILSDNTIYSYLISDASIDYRGRGVVGDAAKPGILSRVINWLF